MADSMDIKIQCIYRIQYIILVCTLYNILSLHKLYIHYLLKLYIVHYTNCTYIRQIAHTIHKLYKHHTNCKYITQIVHTLHKLYIHYTNCTYIKTLHKLYTHYTNCKYITQIVHTLHKLYIHYTNCTYHTQIVQTSHKL